MTQISLQELRQIADSLSALRGKSVVAAAMRSDQRQLRIELADGYLVMVTVAPDSVGRSRLEVDVVPKRVEQHQLEVRFETAATTVRALVLPNTEEVLLGAIPLEGLDVIIDPLRERLLVSPPEMTNAKVKQVALVN